MSPLFMPRISTMNLSLWDHVYTFICFWNIRKSVVCVPSYALKVIVRWNCINRNDDPIPIFRPPFYAPLTSPPPHFPAHQPLINQRRRGPNAAFVAARACVLATRVLTTLPPLPATMLHTVSYPSARRTRKKPIRRCGGGFELCVLRSK